MMATQENAITHTKQKIEKWSALVKSCREGSCGALYAIDVSNYFECIVAAKGVCFVMKCIGCYYYRSLSQNKYMDDCCCHYLIDTGNMRKIPPSECYRHEGTPYLPKKREPQRWNQ